MAGTPSVGQMSCFIITIVMNDETNHDTCTKNQKYQKPF
jgi:hypothetical protein